MEAISSYLQCLGFGKNIKLGRGWKFWGRKLRLKQMGMGRKSRFREIYTPLFYSAEALKDQGITVKKPAYYPNN